MYPQKLRHMFRAKSYSTHNTTTSAEKKAISRDVAKQLKSEAALFLLGFMVIFNAMANRLGLLISTSACGDMSDLV